MDSVGAEVKFDNVGNPIVGGTSTSVATIIEELADGKTWDDIAFTYPGMDKQSIRACLSFAAKAIRVATPTTSYSQREALLDAMASDLPLSYTGDVSGIKYWLENVGVDGGIKFESPTGRNVSFYLGPARRYYGDPEATLKDGRGRIAFIISRQALIPDDYGWHYTPFDLGEVLYNWRHGHLDSEYRGSTLLDDLLQARLPVFSDQPCHKSLRDSFREFLDGGYVAPDDYLKSWARPRPCEKFGSARNTLYMAASDRWFGRLRPFAPAWTYELLHEGPVTVKLTDILAVVIVRDNATAPYLSGLRSLLGDKLSELEPEGSLRHPDICPMLLESRTSAILQDLMRKN